MLPTCKICGRKNLIISAIQPDKTHLCFTCAKKKRGTRGGATKKPIGAWLILLNLAIIAAAIYAFITSLSAMRGDASFEKTLLPAGIVVALMIVNMTVAKSRRKGNR